MAKDRPAYDASATKRTVSGLVDEAKKRFLLFIICAFGLAYLLSLTSSAAWINLPVATALIIACRYVSLDLNIQRKGMLQNDNTSVTQQKEKRSIENPAFTHQHKKCVNWREKVNSPSVEGAIERFTRHLVSEWVTDLWYSRITPDRDGPEELVNVMNGVLGEISTRAKDVNLVSLLTSDIVHLICDHLKLYRYCQDKIGKEKYVELSSQKRDAELKLILADESKLHPALFSMDAEHKVLQSLSNGLIFITFKEEDLQCSFFRYTARELLACAVARPVLNLANPRFMNERIESLAIYVAKRAATGGEQPPGGAHFPRQSEPPIPSAEQIYQSIDHTSKGLELVKVRHDQSTSLVGVSSKDSLENRNSGFPQSNNLMPATNTSLPFNFPDPSIDIALSYYDNSAKNNIASESARVKWKQKLDDTLPLKKHVLAPEHLENVWTKGRNYAKKEDVPSSRYSCDTSWSTRCATSNTSALSSSKSDRRDHNVIGHTSRSTVSHSVNNTLVRKSPPASVGDQLKHLSDASFETGENIGFKDDVLENEGSDESDAEEDSNVTGLDSPVTRVWESKNKGNVASSNISHPLESTDNPGKKKKKTQSSKSRVLRTSGDAQDILSVAENVSKTGLKDEAEENDLCRSLSGMDASSSTSSLSLSYSPNYIGNNVLADFFIKLRCEVIGANIVRSGSGMFAVYSIAVTDANGNSWSIKRRYRHFEELHRRLKEFPDYHHTLPPKHFLSSGLEVPVVQERCKLLDSYLKKLLHIPSISSSIEIWDFLSVDSQTYVFSDSLSIVQTLSVVLQDKPREKITTSISSSESLDSISPLGRLATSTNENTKLDVHFKERHGLSLRKGKGSASEDIIPHDGETKFENDFSFSIKSDKPQRNALGNSNDGQEIYQTDELEEHSNEQTEEFTSNLSAPLLNLFETVFQLHDRSWIRRQTFWVAKQLLQLGMGDAFDDWLLDKIRFLKKGQIIASAIQRVEQILWPDGIFITKHPKRRRTAAVSSPLTPGNTLDEHLIGEQQLEDARHAKFVHELIIENAPAALTSLIGRKEYERCAQDVYLFLQSPLCLRHLAFDLLELLLLSVFPELDSVVKHYRSDKDHLEPLN